MAKKAFNEEPMLEREALGIKEIKNIIESRKPKHFNGMYVFKLVEGVGGRTSIIKPKCIVVSPSGVKVSLRLATDYNSIFVDEQQTDGTPVTISHIFLDETTAIVDQATAEYLLAHPEYNKRYRLVDLGSDAENDLKAFEEFDSIWDKVKVMKSEEMKAVLLLDTGKSLSEISDMAPSEIKMALLKKTQADPQGMLEIVQDQLLKPIYFYNVGMELGILKQTKNGDIVWKDSGTIICKVPVDKEPSKYTAQYLTNKDNEAVYKRLIEKIESND